MTPQSQNLKILKTIPTIPDEQIRRLVKNAILSVEPKATIILYGSRARGNAAPDSDWDFLILVDGPVDDARRDRLRHQLFPLELEYDLTLTAFLYNRSVWESQRYRASLYRQNVERDGVTL